MNNARSEAGLARQGKLKRHDGSDMFRGPGKCNGCENECQGVAPESSRQTVPILRTFAFPKRSWRTPHSRSQ